MGRPTKLQQPVRTRPDGTVVTAAEEVVDRVRLGAELEDAADSAGITRQTLHTWRQQGGRYRAAHAGGARLTPAQRRYVDFLDAYERAQADAEVVRLGIIMRAAEGGYQLRKVVERESVAPDGTTTIIERTTTTETQAPLWTAAAWWLERRMPAKYARRVAVGGMDANGQLRSLGDQADELTDNLEAFMAGAAAGAQVAAR